MRAAWAITLGMGLLMSAGARAEGSAAYSTFQAPGTDVTVLSIYVSSHPDLCGMVKTGHFPTYARTTWIGAYAVGPEATPDVYVVVPGETFQQYTQSLEGAPNERLITSKFVTDSQGRPRHVRHAKAGTLHFEAADVAGHGPLRGAAIVYYAGEAAQILPFTASYCGALSGE